MKILILGLGNELLSDDGVGILAARNLKEQLDDSVEVIESSLSGIALLELFAGHDKAIVIDAVCTGRDPAGFIREFDSASLGPVLAPSPHYSGLPEILALARQLEVEFPREIRIFAVETGDMTTIGGTLSKPVAAALAPLTGRVVALVREWQREKLHA
jgi:hydrogenase maturation protease